MEGIQFVSADRWWQGLRDRYIQEGIRFSPERLEGDQAIPAALFSSVAENLLENALIKRHAMASLQIEVEFDAGERRRLTVCDDGPAIPAEVAEALFHAPVASSTGLGIGLYQSARHAEYYGYVLRMEMNRAGRVCFELRQSAAGELPSRQ
jgi:signal transduction histidine kinase